MNDFLKITVSIPTDKFYHVKTDLQYSKIDNRQVIIEQVSNPFSSVNLNNRETLQIDNIDYFFINESETTIHVVSGKTVFAIHKCS